MMLSHRHGYLMVVLRQAGQKWRSGSHSGLKVFLVFGIRATVGFRGLKAMQKGCRKLHRSASNALSDR